MKTRMARIALAVASLLLVLACFEVGFRLAGFRPIYEVYSKPSVLWRYDALLGWSHQPNSVEIYRGPRPWPIEYSNEIRINSAGLRGKEIAEREEGTYRILFLGDSMIAGFEVAEHETVVARVEERLDATFPFDVETINGGVRGYGTDQSLLYYRSKGRALRPDLVIFLHSANDVLNNMTLHRVRRSFGKGVFALRPDGTLEQRGIPVPDYPVCSSVAMNDRFEVERVDTALSRAACALEMNLSDHSAFFTWVTQILRRSPHLVRWLHRLGTGTADAASAALGPLAPSPAWAQSADSSAARTLTSAIIKEMHREVLADGTDYLLWISKQRLAQLEPHGLRDTGLEVLSVNVDDANRYRYSIQFENDSHWNAYGHRLIADNIAEQLTERIRRDRRP